MPRMRMGGGEAEVRGQRSAVRSQKSEVRRLVPGADAPGFPGEGDDAAAEAHEPRAGFAIVAAEDVADATAEQADAEGEDNAAPDVGRGMFESGAGVTALGVA